MGKKRVAQKTEEELIKESKAVNETLTEKKKQSSKKKHESGRVYIQASYNNTLMTVTDDNGEVITWMSAGSLGFSGPKKATPFAASKVAEAVSEKIQKSGPLTVDVFVKGVGSGRDSAVRSLASRGFNIRSLKDITPIPHNGPRAKKPRRV
ncbi:30S ribosomal protein S11 [bacterium]|nr:30S ribosomal protein S11 [bacterium]|tara:strand:- start:1518 stop:1970 length:453 start_codon:yes stop_codon:yes gene_type:complete